MSKATTLGAQLEAKRAEWLELWNSKPDGDHSAETVLELKRLNDEMTTLAKDYEEAATLEQVAERNRKAAEDQRQPVDRLPTPQTPVRQQQKDLHTLISESKEYEAFRDRQTKKAVFHSDMLDVKTLLTLADINNPATRLPQIVPYLTEERTVGDLMLQGQTNNNTISYMEETTFTNNAATRAEGVEKPESALDFTERTESVRKIATWLPATDELLSDMPMMESYIRGRLGFMVERHEESQLLTGNGTPPNLLGLLNRGIQTQAKGGDPTPDAVYKAMTKVRNTGFAEPTDAVFHPNDWQDIRLLRTVDGIYIWGSPADAGPDRIWGLGVRITTGMTENTGLVGAFRPFAQIFRRQGVTITVSTEHASYFIENKVAILAESRLALAVYRPYAFCSVTGI